MASKKTVFNTTYQCYWDMKRAQKAFDNCAFTWDVEGLSIRMMTVAEAVEARNAQAATRESMSEKLPLTEVSGLKYVRPTTTKYRAPRDAYDDMNVPMWVGRLCRLPRATAA